MALDMDAARRVHDRLTQHVESDCEVSVFGCLTCDAAAVLHYLLTKMPAPGTPEGRLVALLERKDREHAAEVDRLKAALKSRDQSLNGILQKMDEFMAEVEEANSDADPR